MSTAAELVLGGIRSGIRATRDMGGTVNRITTTPVIRRGILHHLGGSVDSELVIDGAHVVADNTLPTGMIHFTWWEA